MNIDKRHIVHLGQGRRMLCLAWVLMSLVASAFAQEVTETNVTTAREQRRDEMHIRFRVSRNVIDPRYMNNADSLKRIIQCVDEV